VWGDPHLLRHLLLNLFDNARRHNTPEGWIAARLEKKDNLAVFTLRNSGRPIGKEAQGRLFERFFRDESSRDRSAGGAGLGLSLCSEIAAAHRGRLRLVSSDAEETAFELVLPITQEEAKIVPQG
jgi:signal transduction histidine kinase